MSSNRAIIKKQIGALYKRCHGHPLDRCAYCNGPRQALDHCPPLALAIDLDLDKFRKNGGELLLYPSCHCCNGMLGAKRLATYEERLLYLYDRYSKEIDRRNKLWTEDEIADLGRGLKNIVLASTQDIKRKIIALRGIEENLLRL